MKVTCYNLVLVRILKKGYNKGGGNREGSGTFMFNTNCQKNYKLVLSMVGW